MSGTTKKTIGQSSIKVSSMGLGCWGLTGAYGQVDRLEVNKLIHEAIESGINLLDTADVYAQGENERLVGEAIKENRAKVVLATKFGYVGDEQGKMYIDGSPAYVRQAVEASLRRLKTAYIDLYYLHRVDPKTPIEETIGAMARLREEGKIRAIGLSEAGKQTLEKADCITQIDALQSEYSLFTQNIEKEILPFCAENKISLVAFSPLGRGMLSNMINDLILAETDYRRSLPRFQGEAFKKNQILVKKLQNVAAAKGITLTQMALAWVLQRGDGVIPIPGTTKIAHLKSNLQAGKVTFSTEEWREVTDLGRQIKGARHNAENARFFEDSSEGRS